MYFVKSKHMSKSFNFGSEKRDRMRGHGYYAMANIFPDRSDTATAKCDDFYVHKHRSESTHGCMPQTYFDRSYKPSEGNHKMDTREYKAEDELVNVNHIKTGQEPHNEYDYKNQPSRWKWTKDFEREDLKVYYCGFESTSGMLMDCGWTIIQEYNRFTGKVKLCFRNPSDGVTTRLPYEKDWDSIILSKLFSGHNYKFKAAKETEMIPELTKEMIPAILEWMRDAVQDESLARIRKQRRNTPVDRVVELFNNDQAA